jgi:plasmid stabilization system protein ParE
MIEHVVFTPDADADVFESYNWYQACEPGLGDEFLRCVEQCIWKIRRQPLIFPVAVDGFRRALVRRFPFEIFYEPSDEKITVYSVFHCSQSPEKWRSRLDR